MRQSADPVALPSVHPTLEAVRKRFETWRKKGRARSPIPDALWDAAVELCRNHSIGKVCRALRLDYYGLKKRVHKSKDVGSNLGFVKLDLGAPVISPLEWRVEMEAPNGAKMILSLKGAPRDLNALELSRAFWSQGR